MDGFFYFFFFFFFPVFIVKDRKLGKKKIIEIKNRIKDRMIKRPEAMDRFPRRTNRLSKEWKT